ncbi:MAG: calcium-binding protein [Streptococcaceae bacterium]|jgi:hypothetical protein|nr:calcium-binding protein [Streptococcaceae bacterium]
MKKKFLHKILISASLIVFLALLSKAVSADTTMFRLYNPNSGEHFYTALAYERDSLKRDGWRDEGTGWIAPDTGKNVYRLYNPNSGDHHYTMKKFERDALVGLGWRYEGVGWKSGGKVALYRQYNPNTKTGTHNYTASKFERDHLIDIGWRDEKVGWYAVSTK